MPEPLGGPTAAKTANLSVVIPVCNAEVVLTRLFDRLYPVLDALGQRYEAVFVDDGSHDRSATLLRQQHKLRPDTTRVLYLRGSWGQAAAIVAGLASCKGERVVTLDAGGRIGPQAIPDLLAELDRGHDVALAARRPPGKSTWRDTALGLIARLGDRLTADCASAAGSCLQGYDRAVVDAVLACGGSRIGIPALACRLASNPVHILMPDDAGSDGARPAPFHRQFLSNIEQITRLTLAPLRGLSLLAAASSVIALGWAIYLGSRWLATGPEVDGFSGLLGILFLLMGFGLLGTAAVAAYLLRLIEQTQPGPLYLVREELAPGGASRRTRA